VTGLNRGSFARNLGIQRGDIIARINGVDIKNVEQLRKLVSVDQDEWTLTIERDGKSKTVTVR